MTAQCLPFLFRKSGPKIPTAIDYSGPEGKTAEATICLYPEPCITQLRQSSTVMPMSFALLGQ